MTALVDLKPAPGALYSGEVLGQCAGNNDASHLDITLDDDLLNIVTKIGHCGERVPPHRFLLVSA